MASSNAGDRDVVSRVARAPAEARRPRFDPDPPRMIWATAAGHGVHTLSAPPLMRNAPDAKSPLTLSALALALLVPLVGCDDEQSEGRPQTDYDGVEDVDPDEYADGEEAPTVVEASSRWNASRGIDHHNYSNGEARPPEDCFMHLDTGHIGWDGNGPSDRQLTLGKAAIACGPMRLTVGYVDNWGRNRSMSEWTPTSGGWWQNEYEVNLDLMDGRRYPQYVQLCRTSVSPQACYTMYRPQG